MNKIVKIILNISIYICYLCLNIYYILMLMHNFDNDYSYYRSYDMMEFSLLIKTTIVFIVYILITYFYKKYLIKISLYFNYIFYFLLISDVWSDLNYHPNTTTYYYFYYYIWLTIIHTLILFFYMKRYFDYKKSSLNSK